MAQFLGWKCDGCTTIVQHDKTDFPPEGWVTVIVSQEAKPSDKFFFHDEPCQLKWSKLRDKARKDAEKNAITAEDSAIERARAVSSPATRTEERRELANA